jgi:hypothetical protein
MNNEQSPSEGVFKRAFGRLVCCRAMRRCLFVAACLTTLTGLFYAVENWRGRRTWEKCRRELEAKGEVLDWDALVPALVPDEKNIFKAPRMTEWFVKGSFAEAFSGAPSKAGNADAPFQLAPRQNAEAGPVLVAEVQVATTKEPLPPGNADAVLRYEDPAASGRAARLILGRIGPCTEGASGCTITARPLSQDHPVYLVVQADKVPSAKALAEFFPRNPVPHNSFGAYLNERFQVEGAGNNGFLVSVKPPMYTAAEYLDLSQGALPDFDVLRKALERPLARMDGNYQRPYEHPVENFVRLRTVAQMLSQRAQCYLLLGQPEAAWHELALVRDMCRMLEAKPSSDCPTLVQDMIDVAIGGLYVGVIQDGLRLAVWREPELAAIQKQLMEINFLPLLHRGFQAERAATCRTLEITPPRELKKLFSLGVEQQGLWDKLKNPRFLFLTFGPSGWLFQNMNAGAPQEQALLEAFDIPNNRVLPGKLAGVTALSRSSPYSFLAAEALPTFVKATQTMARNQTLANEAFIACGLQRYRAAHGQYPKTLEALVPQFAAKLPHDLIGGEPLKYERTADDRFDLYSLGWNAKDDGGFAGKTITAGDWVW